MKALFELENLIVDSSNKTNNYYINYNDFSKIYGKVVAYEPCNTISNLENFFDNYRSPYQKNKSFLELAKSGHFDNQNKITIDSLLYSAKYLEYEMYSMVPELIEYTANSEDGEIVEVESEDSDVQTDDSDDSGDGDDDDPSHHLALTFVSNNFYYDNQSKARKVNRQSFYKSIAKQLKTAQNFFNIILTIIIILEKFQTITPVQNISFLLVLFKLILKYIFNNI